MQSRPLISTDVGSGTSYVNVDDETGLVVEPNSPSALRHAMDRLWHDPAQAARLGENARKRYETLFNGRLMGAQYHALYEELKGSHDQKLGHLAERGVY